MRISQALRSNKLNILIIIGIGLGVLLGIVSPQGASYAAPLGQIFLRLLTLLVVPIIFFSVLAGVIGVGSGQALGRVGLRALLYYCSTTAIAVLTGLLVVNLTSPGMHAFGSITAPSQDSVANRSVNSVTVWERILPTNLVAAAAEGNVLPLIFFSIALGSALIYSRHKGVATVVDVVQAINAALLKLVDALMLLTPIGVFGLIAGLVGDFVTTHSLATLGSAIIEYSLTVVGALLIHGILSLGGLCWWFGVSPIRLASAVQPALMAAFSTASSSATLPLTIESLERRAGVPPDIAGFVAPLGATVNMDGTALYEAIAVVFIATLYGVTLDVSDQIIVFLTATLAAIGAASIPSAGLVMMTFVLGSVGLPIEGIQLIVVADRLLDMVRTATNVWGDCVGSAILSASERRYPKPG